MLENFEENNRHKLSELIKNDLKQLEALEDIFLMLLLKHITITTIIQNQLQVS